MTAADGRVNRVAVITGDHNGVAYDQHIVRASGAAGAGEAHPALVDGTPATVVQFVDGNLQTAVPPATFDTYTIGSYADIRLTSPPVTLSLLAWIVHGCKQPKHSRMLTHRELMNTCLSKQN